MRPDTKLKWILIGGMDLVAVVWIVAGGYSFPVRDLASTVGVGALLSALLFYYHGRGEEQFVVTLQGLLQVVLFSVAFTVLMYLGATLNRPLIDDSLVAWDARFGFHLPTLLAWCDAHPTVERLLARSYNTLLPQTAAVLVLLGFAGHLRDLEQFVLRFMVAALLMLVVYMAFPAEGPFTAYGFSPSAAQARYLDHFHALRDGTRTTVSFHGAEGLITFPSFHTTWALLLALAFYPRWRWFLPFALLNLAVVASTMTTGWHYLSDVLAGCFLCGIAVALGNAVARWPAVSKEAEVVRSAGDVQRRLLPLGRTSKSVP